MGAACRRRGGAGNLIAPNPRGGATRTQRGRVLFPVPRSRRRDAQARWAAQRTSRGVHAGTGEAGLRTRPSRRVRFVPRCPSWASPGAAPLPPPLPLHVGVGWMDPQRVRSLTSLVEVLWAMWLRLSRWRRWGGLDDAAPVAAATGPPRGSASSHSSASPGGAVLEAPRSPPEHPPGPSLGGTAATLATRQTSDRSQAACHYLRPFGAAPPEDDEARHRDGRRRGSNLPRPATASGTTEADRCGSRRSSRCRRTAPSFRSRGAGVGQRQPASPPVFLPTPPVDRPQGRNLLAPRTRSAGPRRPMAAVALPRAAHVTLRPSEGVELAVGGAADQAGSVDAARPVPAPRHTAARAAGR